MSNNNRERTESYFVVDNTGAYSVIYLDSSANSKIQFVWKDEMSKSKNENNVNKENDYLPFQTHW